MFNTTPNLVSSSNVKSLSGNRGWALTLAIFLFLFAVILILGSIGNLINGIGTIGPFINFLIGLFYIFAGVKFCTYFGKIGTAFQTQNSIVLESAIEALAKAWTWLGITSLFYLIILIIAILASLS